MQIIRRASDAAQERGAQVNLFCQVPECRQPTAGYQFCIRCDLSGDGARIVGAAVAFGLMGMAEAIRTRPFDPFARMRAEHGNGDPKEKA